MDAIEIDLAYWHLRLDGEVIEVLSADGASSRIHARHVVVNPFGAAVDQTNAPGGMSVVLHSIRRGALWSQFDVPVDKVDAVKDLFARVSALQAAAGRTP